ncbi:chromatin assembly factor 1 subunit A [Drosophila guanche]|uniref:Blast:Chromatin assembly factor 1 subunit A n=1 Tax=Drosophila guanche TaxID=7266 RepID=A0A3B0JDB1_DROGU|nr:chromatin assembly factor 1 subunit A [Drosophila guanche]SPP78102.1 blast:Chromatin assembly factor 1 subunit A [Drosophila guanche]
MPAGTIQTPSSKTNTKDAIQKSADRTCTTGSGGKKLVQTRLPFKLITPVASTAVAAAATATSSSASATALPDSEESPAQEPRKRRLSYSDEKSSSDDTPQLDQQRRSNSKENLAVGVGVTVGAAKKTKILEVLPMAEEVIELADSSDEIEEPKALATPPAAAKIQRKPKAKPRHREKATPSPIQIKLPLLSKRASKRRKSAKIPEKATLKEEEEDVGHPEETTGSDNEPNDEEEVSAEKLYPLKRLKVVLPKGKKTARKGKETKETNEEKTKEEVLNAVEKITAEVQQTVQEITKEKEIEEQKIKGEKAAQTLTSGKKGEQPKADKQKSPRAKKQEGKRTKAEAELSATREDTKLQEDVGCLLEQHSQNEEQQTTVEQTEETKLVQDDSPDDDDVMMLTSSDSEHERSDQSSTDHEMEVDTDAPDRQSVGGKEKASTRRRSVHDVAGGQADGELKGKGQALTAKQQRLFEQRRKAREEKEHKLQEERRLKQQEKEQREQLRKVERDQKEELRRKERDEKEEQRRKEREEKERKRQAEVDSKNEEKRKRNEAKEEVQRKRDEEKRRKELEKEEAEQKKKRAAESFTKFFVQKLPKGAGSGSGPGLDASATLELEQSSCDSTKMSCPSLAFRPFQVKDDMLLAPIVRTSLGGQQRSQLDGLFRERSEDASEEEEEEPEDIRRRKRPNRNQLYLSELAKGTRQPLKMQRDVRLHRRTKEEESEEEVQVIDDLTTAGTPIEQEEQAKQMPRMRAKYLQFADNRRPAYYGTWRKKSQSISARRPLAQDKVHFDYEVDSDCEWEEEEPGESLSASEDEKERESEEESEEEYNEWYVPHGHLSDEELQHDGEMDDGHTREAQQAKLQVLQQEFAQEMKKQTRKIKPRLFGPIWLDENGNKSPLCPAVFAQTIDSYGSWQLEPVSMEPPPEKVREAATASAPASPLQLDERLLQQLVRLTHGNRNAKAFLISEYLEYLKTQTSQESQQLPSKALIREKFDELATWSTMELSAADAAAGSSSAKKSKKPKKRLCWMVGPEMLEKFQLAELSLQNQWEYTLTPKITEAEPQHELSPPAEPELPSKEAKESPVAPTDAPSMSSTPTQQVATKKRIALISGPRELSGPVASKNGLISQFLRRQRDASPSSKPAPKGNSTKVKASSVAAATAEEAAEVVLLSD